MMKRSVSISLSVPNESKQISKVTTSYNDYGHFYRIIKPLNSLGVISRNEPAIHVWVHLLKMVHRAFSRTDNVNSWSLRKHRRRSPASRTLHWRKRSNRLRTRQTRRSPTKVGDEWPANQRTLCLCLWMSLPRYVNTTMFFCQVSSLTPAIVHLFPVLLRLGLWDIYAIDR